MLSRHAGSLYYGLEQIAILRALNQFFSSALWKTPHHSMSLYTPCIHTCFFGCELYGLHEWATTWFPPNELYIHTHIPGTWATRGEPYELIIRQDHLHNIQAFAGCELYAIAYLYSMINVFRGWAMGHKWASSWSVWRMRNHIDRNQSVALVSIWHCLC